MVPQKVLKKENKAHKPNKTGKGIKRPPASSRLVTRRSVTSKAGTPKAASLLPIISTLEFPASVARPAASLQPVKKWCFKNGTPVIRPHLKRSYVVNDQEVIVFEGPALSYSLKRGNIVRVKQQNIKIPGDVPLSSWSEITFEETSYDRALKQWVTSRVTGWVNNAYFDNYHEKFPDFEVEIPHATKNSNDPQQFMTIKDEGYSEFNIRTNMCGQLCVAFVIKESIDTVLENWREKGKKNYYQSLVGRGQNKVTTRVHLKDILDLYYSNPDDVLPFRGPGSIAIPLAAPSTEPNYPHASSEFEEKLKTHYLITLVRIDLGTGELKPTEQPGQRNHWIVVDKITRNGNRVELYNPFPNRRQEYSFQEFYKSIGSNPFSGWWVKRKIVSANKSVPNFLDFKSSMKVAIANPNPTYTAAQYIDVEGKKKTNLCGEFCVAFIVKDSIDAVLEKWKTDQPLLYADIIGNNRTTGANDLETILRSYGYNNVGDIVGFSAALGDPYTRQYLPSPGRIAKMLRTHFLIAGVNIDGRTGRLKPPAAVPHWVVVNNITPVGRSAGGNGGWVKLYNPFSNSWEEYSYSEFANSIGPQARDYGAGWSGLWVKRNIVPKFVPPIVIQPGGAVSPAQGRIPQQSSQRRKWTEAQLLAVLKQRISTGRPVNRIAAELVKISGWKKEEILDRGKKLIKGSTAGKWTEAQLRAEMARRSKAKKPAHKIAAELAEISGWKRQDILNKLRKPFKAGGGEKWTEEQMLVAIQEKLKTTKSANKIAATLMEGSGWKNWEIHKLLKAMRAAEKTNGSNSHITDEDHSTIVVDSQTIVQASKPWADFRQWQNGLLALPGSRLYRVRRWGDPVMINYSFDVNQSTRSNFQAVGLYNDGNNEFGAVSSFIRISHEDVMRLKALQIEDEYEDKKEDWRKQKMNWLCKFRGTIYFFDEETDKWDSAPFIRWGTLALGGNLVQVEGTEVIKAKLRDGVKREVEMARLKGFRASDWHRPLDDLLAEGLVHRCFCAYHHNHFGDSPKGIVYSPFYSLLDWDFSGTAKPRALYIPVEWLEPKTLEYLSSE